MKDKKSALIISFSDLSRDPRVFRQIFFLKENYQIAAAGYAEPLSRNIDFYPVQPPLRSFAWKFLAACQLKIKAFDQHYWSSRAVKSAFKQLAQQRYDIIIANDLNTLPLALKLSDIYQCKVLLDAHEYTPRDFDDRWSFRVFFQDYWEYICRKYLPQVNEMTTVCKGIAEEYQKNYAVSCQVITNAPFYESLEPSEVDQSCIRLIHHGGLNRSRKIENMIFLMDLLDDRFRLDFMLLSKNQSSLQQLKDLARNRKRIQFRDPVPMPDISRTINEYDIGLFLLWPAAFSYRLALPNKLFEFIQGRLSVAIWPSPEMARIVNQYNCGVVAEDFTVEAMAERLNGLSVEDIKKFKQSSHQAANTLCAETNHQIFLGAVEKSLRVTT